MKPRVSSSHSAKARGPAPSQVGATLLAHDLMNLASRLAMLQGNLEAQYGEVEFKGAALRLLEDSVRHLTRLSADLREHEGRVLMKLRVDLNQVLMQALGDTRPDLAEELALIQNYQELPPIWGDALLLRQAFACAIENALTAMDYRGTLAVGTEYFPTPRSRRILVEIADDGPGMSAPFLKKALSVPLASAKGDGHGLGLYTIRQVTSLHGGTIRLESGAGRGTRVRFSFPVDME